MLVILCYNIFSALASANDIRKTSKYEDNEY